MAINSKLKALLNLTNSKPSDIAKCLGISVQAVRNKFSRNSFTASDLIKIADHLGVELAFIINGNQKVILNEDDM